MLKRLVRDAGTILLLMLLASILMIPGWLLAFSTTTLGWHKTAAVLGVLGSWGGGALVLVLARSRWPEGWRNRVGLVLPDFRVWKPFALALSGLLFIVMAGFFAIHRVKPLPEPTHLKQISLWTIALGGPVFEEFLFRGYALGRQMERGSGRRALVITTLAFMLCHHWVQYPSSAAMGLLLGWVTLRSGSLLPAVVGHTAWNSSLAILNVLGAKWDAGTSQPPASQLIGLAVIGIPMLWMGLRGLRAAWVVEKVSEEKVLDEETGGCQALG